MMFPLSLDDLSILLAVTAIMLLVASELLSPHPRRVNTLINRKRLRRIAIVFSIFFIVTVGIRVYDIILAS